MKENMSDSLLTFTSCSGLSGGKLDSLVKSPVWCVGGVG